MRQQVADRSPQRHATLPTYYKILLRTEKVLLQYYPVVQSTPPYYSVLQSVLRTTKCYSSTTLYYTALLCSTNYYSSTTLYYKVLVLLCTTKYYSSTTLYYTVLLQYYSVLQSTTPVLLCTTPVLLQYSLLSTQSFSHRSDNVTPSSSSHSVAVRNDIRHGTMRSGAVRPWGRSPQRHTTVQLTQSATTYDNYTSHSLRSLARMPQIRQVLHPSSYGNDVPRKRFYTG